MLAWFGLKAQFLDPLRSDVQAKQLLLSDRARAGFLILSSDGLSLPQIGELASLAEIGTSSRDESLRYRSDGTLLYWPIELVQNVSKFVK